MFTQYWWENAFPVWLEAISTSLAFMAAAVAAIYAARVYKRESARERRLEEAQRRAQASLISGWVDTVQRRADPRPSVGREYETVACVYLRNASELPVFEVEIALRGTSVQPDPTVALEVLPPSDKPKLVGPEDFDFDWDGDGRVSLTFTDSSGKTWRRLANGQLLDPDEDGVGWAGISFA